MQIPNRIVAQSLELARKNAKEGMSLAELDSIIEDFILSCGAKPAFKGLYGFPCAACISVNEVIIHGIPTDYKLKRGDIVGVDVGAEHNGWFGDGAITFGIGEIDPQDKQLVQCSKDALYHAIVKGFCGHGIGRAPHEEPEIPNFLESPNPKQGPKIREGMVFCIEPMVCQKSGEPKVLGDNWSVVSVDGLNGSHYEHTVAIIGGKARILTEA